MSAKDAIHDAVKNALRKAGWTVTADPHTIRYAELTLLADLAAERSFAAERGGDKIVVEMKSFAGPSAVQDFKLALGQYLVYQTFLEAISPDRKLYLAIPAEAYRTFFSQAAIRLVVDRFRLALLVVDVQSEEVVSWIS